MKLLIASDLHFEFHPDKGQSWVASMPDADIFVCAGDLSDARGLKDALALLCRKWPKIIYVCGNHEFYGSSIGTVRRQLAEYDLPGLRYLHNDVFDLESGLQIVGTTLWFPRLPGIERKHIHINDFHHIADASTKIYEENEQALEFLDKTVRKNSIVVTHHLPSPRCTHDKFKNSVINCFFVCDVEKLIEDRQPSLWIHGHTHESMDFKIGSTRVLCNPFGYVGMGINPKFRKDLLLEV